MFSAIGFIFLFVAALLAPLLVVSLPVIQFLRWQERRKIKGNLFSAIKIFFMEKYGWIISTGKWLEKSVHRLGKSSWDFLLNFDQGIRNFFGKISRKEKNTKVEKVKIVEEQEGSVTENTGEETKLISISKSEPDPACQGQKFRQENLETVESFFTGFRPITENDDVFGPEWNTRWEVACFVNFGLPTVQEKTVGKVEEEIMAETYVLPEMNKTENTQNNTLTDNEINNLIAEVNVNEGGNMNIFERIAEALNLGKKLGNSPEEKQAHQELVISEMKARVAANYNEAAAMDKDSLQLRQEWLDGKAALLPREREVRDSYARFFAETAQIGKHLEGKSIGRRPESRPAANNVNILEAVTAE